MANPQIENGHTKIANDLFEKIISSGLNGTEICVILFLIRKTYGFQKKEDHISLSQFLACIPVSRPTICKTLKTLQLVKIIKLVKKGNSKKMANLYALNKNYDEWQLVKKTKLVKFSNSTSKDFEIQLVKKTLPTKESITKEIYTKETTTMAKKIFGILKMQNQALLGEIDLLLEKYPSKDLELIAIKVSGILINALPDIRWLKFVNMCGSEFDRKQQYRGITII